MIFSRLPIAVFARPTYCLRGLAELAAKRYARRRMVPAAARRLAEIAPPVWVFMPSKLDAHSATEIRSEAMRQRKRKERVRQRQRR